MSRFALLSLTAICFATGIARAELCSTQSHGVVFEGTADVVNEAVGAALGACQRSSVTVNQECEQNLACGESVTTAYPSGTAVCLTSSRALVFQSAGPSGLVGTLLGSVLGQCQTSSFTVNAECAAHVTCGDPAKLPLAYPSLKVQCSSTSHGMRFVQSGDADKLSLVAGLAVQQCQTLSVTNNAECAQQSECVDSARVTPGTRAEDPVTCRTTSHRIPYQESGPRSQLASLAAKVLGECRTNPVTRNEECEKNLACP